MVSCLLTTNFKLATVVQITILGRASHRVTRPNGLAVSSQFVMPRTLPADDAKAAAYELHQQKCQTTACSYLRMQRTDLRPPARWQYDMAMPGIYVGCMR